jgi:chromosome segregation ATPase
MPEIEQHIERINNKLSQLLKQHEILQKENSKLKVDLKKLQTEHDSKSVHIDQLQEQAQILKLSKSEMGEADKKTFEKRLNQYIKEIDRCITLLNE